MGLKAVNTDIALLTTMESNRFALNLDLSLGHLSACVSFSQILCCLCHGHKSRTEKWINMDLIKYIMCSGALYVIAHQKMLRGGRRFTGIININLIHFFQFLLTWWMLFWLESWFPLGTAVFLQREISSKKSYYRWHRFTAPEDLIQETRGGGERQMWSWCIMLLSAH